MAVVNGIVAVLARRMGAVALISAGAALMASPVMAQDGAGPDAVSDQGRIPDPEQAAEAKARLSEGSNAVCLVVAPELAARAAGLDVPSDGPAAVYASCQEEGFVLGTADTLQTAVEASSGAVVAILTNEIGTWAWLLSDAGDGTVLRENITGTLSRASGGTLFTGLDDVAVDLSRFEREGVIALTPRPREGGRAATAGTYNVNGLLASERSRRASVVPAQGAAS